MKKLSKEVYNQIRSWIYRNARHIELTRWQYHFEGGSCNTVIEALSFYQNEDGGFGNGLEPDCLNPHSHPVATDMAYGVLKSLKCDNKDNPMIQGIMKFIENTDYFTEHGWYWSIPSNNNYPCEPYYQYPNAPWFPCDWPPENYIHSAMFGFVLKYFDKEHEIYKKTLRVIEYRVSQMHKYANFCAITNECIQETLEANDWVGLIEVIDEYKLKSTDECQRLAAEFLKIVDVSALESVRKEIRERIEKKAISEDELDAKIDNLSLGRLWNKEGLWSEKPEDKKYEVSSISALLWPILDVMDDMLILKEHDRLE